MVAHQGPNARAGVTTALPWLERNTPVTQQIATALDPEGLLGRSFS